MATLRQVIVAVADQIRDYIEPATDAYTEEINFQVEPTIVLTPSEICVDVFPALGSSTDESLASFGKTWIGAEIITVRTRIATGASDDAQAVLLDMMDDETDLSIGAAILDDKTLNGNAQTLKIAGQSGFNIYPDLSGEANWLGFELMLLVVKARS